MPRLRDFLEQEFHVVLGESKERYPGLPLFMSLIDTALDRRQAFSAKWGSSAVNALREQVEFGIFDLLEERLESVPTNNHFLLLNLLYPEFGTDPCIISTNYDLLADTALMFLGQTRGPEGIGDGRVPDYCCHISTSVYGELARFGKLLKLHGSLNWLYCKTCRRLELGASATRLYIKAMNRLNVPNIKQAFTPDGDPCPACGTRLRPLLIAPTHMKDYRNPHITQVWYEAELLLRNASRVVFIGYSLPDDDVEVVYLLKRSLSHLAPRDITVVGFDAAKPNLAAVDHPVGRRYRTLFGDAIDWHACGLDGWLERAFPGDGSTQGR
ncbi:hypothetical protein WL82_28900 [Burkholderia ubonensis]|nr:hypothetical protein WL82_28900 [Burkholderia ubonensis]